MSGNRFFWLKLKRDFFKRHDIRIIEGKPDGDKMVLFYLKLLCESVDHDGALRFSDEVSYDNEMLASVTGTDISIVEKAMDILEKLKMVNTDDDGTIIMNGLDSMLGSETKWAGKKREQREKEGQEKDNVPDMSSICPQNVRKKEGQAKDNVRQSKSIEKEKEKELELEKDISLSRKTSKFVAPSVEEVKEYCRERNNDVDAERFISYYQSNGWMVGRNHMKDWKATIRTWERRNKESGFSGKQTKPDVPYMQNEYSQEHLEKKEQESLDVLDALLAD